MTINKPHNLAPLTLALASPVNANFDTVYDFINDNVVNGSGSPEGVVTATRGTLYLDKSGSGQVYRKTTNTGNTGWVEIVNAGVIDNVLSITDMNISVSGQNILPKTYSNISELFLDSWISKNPMVATRRNIGSLGNASCAMAIAGEVPSVSLRIDTEIFNGDTWSIRDSLSSTDKMHNVSLGNRNSIINFGGFRFPPSVLNATDRFNGVAWSITGVLVGQVMSHGGFGNSNLAICAGGDNGNFSTASLGTTDLVQKGLSHAWSTAPLLITARREQGACGIYNNGLMVAGSGRRFDTGSPYSINQCEVFNGTSWRSASAALSTRSTGSCVGVVSASYLFGGFFHSPPSTPLHSSTEKFNGIYWRAGSPILSTGTFGSCGTSNASLAYSDSITQLYLGNIECKLDILYKTEQDFASSDIKQNASNLEVVLDLDFTPKMSTLEKEEFNLIMSETNIFGMPSPVYLYSNRFSKFSRYVSTTSMLSAKSGAGAYGVVNNTFSCGGWTTASNATSSSELYNDITWQAKSNLGVSRADACSFGLAASGIISGGKSTDIGVDLISVEKYTPDLWSSSTSMLSARSKHIGLGTTNSGLVCGDNNEKFNGTSWSSAPNLTVSRSYHFGSGSYYNCLASGGESITNSSEKFNGVVWSTVRTTLFTKKSAGACGLGNNIRVSGGNTSTISDLTEIFNGMDWVVSCNLNTAKSRLSSSGSSYSNLALGGDTTVSFSASASVSKCSTLSLGSNLALGKFYYLQE